MDIQIGLGCKDQALCDQIGFIIGYFILAVLIGFVAYVIYKVIDNKK